MDQASHPAGELGKKPPKRRLTLLILPGALYLAVAATAGGLGHTHALDLHRLTTHVTGWAKSPTATTFGGQVVVAAAVVVGAVVIGLAAQALGSGIEWLVLAAGWGTWPSPLRAWAQRRDRIHAVTIRLRRDLTVDLPTVWPCLWLHFPEATRTRVTTARQAITSATTLTGWALLYLPLAWWWWPALPTAATLTTIGWHRIRITTDTYAQLIEAATRRHIRGLATQLGIDLTGKALPAIGATVTQHLRTQPPPPTTPAGRRTEGNAYLT